MLVFCPDVTGEMIVVDPEGFDAVRNPFRYPALTGDETGAKATWTARLLQDAGWQAVNARPRNRRSTLGNPRNHTIHGACTGP